MDAVRHAGRVALVAGASRGIGREIAARLAAGGASVYAAARDRERLSALANDPVTRGRVIPFPTDLLAPGIERDLATRIPEVDIVVCAAAAPLAHGTLLETGERTWQEQWSFSVDLPRRLVTWAAPLMRRRGGGSFVFLSTVAARWPHAGLGAYGVGKAGLDALMRSAAMELGRDGIRCNCVAPGLVHTERTHALITATRLADEQRRATPLGELASPADVAQTVAWLVSDEARIITGQVVTVDGGHSIGTFRGDG